MLNPDRKFWNEQQKILQSVLSRKGEHQNAIELCLSQHGMVHTAMMAQSGLWSFEDELWQGMSEDSFRRVPGNGDYSIAWHLWHCTRIEDITMNLLVAGNTQILDNDSWLEKMKVAVRDTGNAMDREAVEALSAAIDMEALRAYRLAVGRRTREIIKKLQPEELKQNVEAFRIQRVLDEGDVVEAAKWLTEYWSKRKIAGLLLMPATRHNFVHLNEASRIKK